MTSGLYQTRDGGRTWTQRLSATTARAFVDPSDPRYIYATAQECSATSECKDYLYRSADRGVTWRRAIDGVVLSLAVHPGSGVVYASPGWVEGGVARLYRSADHGRTWKTITTDLAETGLYSLAVDPRDSNLVLATTGSKAEDEGRLLRSVDGGRTWTEPASSRALAPNQQVVFTRSGDSQLVVSDGPRLSRSTDRGLTWASVLSLSEPDDSIVEVLANPLDAREIFVTAAESGVYRSTDEGATFTRIAAPAKGLHGLHFDRLNPQTLYVRSGDEMLWAYTLPLRSDLPEVRALPGSGGPPRELLAEASAAGAGLLLAGGILVRRFGRRRAE